MNKQIAKLRERLALLLNHSDHPRFRYVTKPYEEIAKEALSLLSSQSQLQTQAGWVPMSAGAPKEQGRSKQYLVQDESGDMFTDTCNYGRWSFNGIVAYRELPAPYTSAGKGE